MKIKRPLVLGVAAGIILSTVAVVTPAFADPVTDSYAVVGSDTLQDSMNALTNGTTVTGSSVRIKAAGQAIGNFDAFGSAKIQTKPGKAQIVRPNGSGAGVTALITAIDGNTGQVDIARSSGGPSATVSENGKLTWIPYGRDAVAYAYYPDPSHPDDLANLDAAALKQIYEADAPLTVGNTVVKPLIPQDQSGTRKFFLSATGVTKLGGLPTATFNNVANSLPENDASVLTQVGQIVPFSVASWIAQSNGAGPSTLTANAVLGKVGGTPAFSVSGGVLSPSSAFYSSSFGRVTYLVVETARITSGNSKYDSVLANLVDPTNTGSLTEFSAASFKSRAGAVKAKFGFLAPLATDTVLQSNVK